MVPAVGIVALTASLQPEMAKQGSLFQQKLEMMPRELLVAFGIGSVDLADPTAYLATNFGLVVLVGAVFAALVGATGLAREEAAGTAELLLAQPIGRRAVAVAKLACGLTLVVVWQGILALVAAATYAILDVPIGDRGAFASLFAGAGLVQAATLGFGMLATVRLGHPRSAPAIAMGVTLGSYVVGVLAALAPAVAGLRWLSPFHYAEPAEIVQSGGLPPSAFVLPIACAIAIVWARKDVHA
jgi:ABC-2 type transport system permease protein